MSDESGAGPTENLSEFEHEYFIQTRREIDTEKQERNKILNYAILATGAVSLLLSKTDIPTRGLESATALWLYFPLLLLVSVLTAARRSKLRQIADRWFTLQEMLHARKLPKGWQPLEEVVCHGLEGRRYLFEDFLLHHALSIILYALILLAAKTLSPRQIAVVVLAVLTHLVWSCVWLLRRIPRLGYPVK